MKERFQISFFGLALEADLKKKKKQKISKKFLKIFLKKTGQLINSKSGQFNLLPTRHNRRCKSVPRAREPYP